MPSPEDHSALYVGGPIGRLIRIVTLADQSHGKLRRP